MKKSGRKLVERPGILWDIQTEPIVMSRLILLQLTERAQHEIGAFLIERGDRFPDRGSQDLVQKSIGDTDYELQSLNLLLGLQILANKDFEIVGDWTESEDGQFHVTITLDPANNFKYLIHLQYPAGLAVSSKMKFRRKPAPTPPLIDPYKLQVSFDNGVTWNDTLFDLSDLPLYRFNPLDVVRGDTNEVVGEWSLVNDSTDPKGLLQENWKLTISPDALGATPGADAPPMEIIHTYTLDPDEESYIQLATEAEQIEFMGGVSDGSTIPYVAGVAPGADAKEIRVIHAYRQEVNAGHFFRLATEGEITAHATLEEAADPTLALHVVGVERGIQGIQGIPGENTTPITDTVANKLDACADPTLTLAAGVLTAGFPVYCPPEPPPPPGVDGEGKRCNVARGAGGFINDLFTDYLNYIDAQFATYSTPLLMVNSILSAIPGFGTAVNFLVTSVSAVYAAGASTVAAQFDSLTRERIECKLFCLLADDGILTDEVFSDWITALDGMLSEPLKSVYIPFLQSLDIVKVRTRAYVYAEIESGCEFCEDCTDPHDWEIILDFTYDSYEDAIIEGSQHYEGNPHGWSTIDYNGFFDKLRLQMRRGGTDSVLTQVVVKNGTNKTVPSGVGSLVAFKYDIGGGLVSDDQDYNFAGGVLVFNMSVALPASYGNFDWEVYLGDYDDHTQYVDWIRWTLRGTGTMPAIQGYDP